MTPNLIPLAQTAPLNTKSLCPIAQLISRTDISYPLDFTQIKPNSWYFFKK